MNLELGSVLMAGAKSIGEMLLKEIRNKMQEEMITADTKAKIAEERNNVINSFGEIYEVKNGEIYKYSGEEYPEFIDAKEINEDVRKLKVGFYKMQGGNLEYDEDLNKNINENIEKRRQSLISEERKFLDSQRVEGEEYIVDEIGDDERYVFLTRESNGVEFQEYKISDELYRDLLNEVDKSNLRLRFSDGEYRIV